MARKLRNKPISRDDAAKKAANEAAKAVLNSWYDTGYHRARKLIPKEQIESNLKVVASIPGWKEQKGFRNG